MPRMKSNSPLVNVIHRVLSEPEILQDNNISDNGKTPQKPRQGSGSTATSHGTGTAAITSYLAGGIRVPRQKLVSTGAAHAENTSWRDLRARLEIRRYHTAPSCLCLAPPFPCTFPPMPPDKRPVDSS